MPAFSGTDNFGGELVFLDKLAEEGRLAAVGETGFDLFDAALRQTEKTQVLLFDAQLETALRYGLPVVLHVRRAMHLVFARAGMLEKCRAVIFHAWPGTQAEGEALLRRRINAYFSIGPAVLRGRRETRRGAAMLPVERLLTETDAPYTGSAGIGEVLAEVAALRMTTPAELEAAVDRNFWEAFGGGGGKPYGSAGIPLTQSPYQQNPRLR